MTITKYRPQAVLTSPFNELVNEFFGRDISQFIGNDELRRTQPATNIIERPDEFELRMSVPGFAKEELKMSVENDTLTLSGEHKAEEKKEDERYTRREFTRSAFSRSFKLPEGVNHEGINASYANGMLHVRIPKADSAKPRTREIAIG
jgi:HSP20 family protein